MKKVLLMMAVAICGLAYRSPDILSALSRPGGGNGSAPMPRAIVEEAALGAPMSLLEYAELARSDPQAYQKLVASMQAREERRELDKLLNFFARGKYE